MEATDVVVLGAGPNGLAAAATLAEAGRSVLVVEGEDEIGGGTRSAELTLPGVIHDVCSSILPLAAASPYLRTLPLERHGLSFVHPGAPLAHPFDDGSAAVLERSVDDTAAGLGEDARAYRRLMGPLVEGIDGLLEDALGPLLPPRRPLAMARFGLGAVRSARGLSEATFVGPRARALVAGIGAHSMLPLDRSPSAGVALLLGALGHAVGWPMARGGSSAIGRALAAHLRSLGGAIETGRRISALDELPRADTIMLDVTPRQLLRIAGDRLPRRYARGLERFRYGPGICKLDLALDGPIPWRAEDCRRAGTVHLGGELSEFAASEAAVHRGEHPERPFVIAAQQSLFDPTRAPEGTQTLWAYCHVPNGSTVDMSERIEAQVERFAPGFRERILSRHTITAAELEAHDPNFVGGDINGGLQDLRQTLARPVAGPNPYRTPIEGVYLCSSSTPPGGGVHGMCGHLAARAALDS